MIAAVQLERRMASAQVLRVVVSKFGHWYEPGLVILLKVHKSLEVCLYRTILSLSLTVNLKVESGKKPPFNAEKVAEQ